MHLRPATADDAAACAHVHHTSWVQTYTGLLPEAFWERATPEARRAVWQRWLGDGTPVTVAEADGLVVGFAIAAPARERGGHAPVRERELASLYVLASHHGTGTGPALLDAVVPPGTPAQLWVAAENPRARRFYARNGFAPDGASFTDAAWGGITEVRYVR